MGWPFGYISWCVLDLNIHQHLSVSTFSFTVISVRVCVCWIWTSIIGAFSSPPFLLFWEIMSMHMSVPCDGGVGVDRNEADAWRWATDPLCGGAAQGLVWGGPCHQDPWQYPWPWLCTHLLLLFLLLVTVPVSWVQGWSAYWLGQWYRVRKVFESVGKMGWAFEGLESLWKLSGVCESLWILSSER